jgi:predicted nucleic acid-binding protein
MKNGFVADASVGVAWAVHAQASAETGKLLDAVASGTPFVVPSLWPFEVANALIVLARRRMILAVECEQALAALARLPVSIDDEGTLHALTDVADLASKTGLSVYDATYLELAVRRRLPLASTDEPLVKAARKHGVHVLLSR